MEVQAKGVEHPITLSEVLGIGGRYKLFLPETAEASSRVACGGDSVSVRPGGGELSRRGGAQRKPDEAVCQGSRSAPGGAVPGFVSRGSVENGMSAGRLGPTCASTEIYPTRGVPAPVSGILLASRVSDRPAGRSRLASGPSGTP